MIIQLHQQKLDLPKLYMLIDVQTTLISVHARRALL
jgi:hypothetical protein